MLCRELARRGHEARFIAHADFQDMIAGSDVVFKPLPGDIRKELDSPQGKAFFAGGANPFAFLNWFYDLAKRYTKETTPHVKEYVQGSDIIVGTGLMDYFSTAVGRATGIKAAHAYMQPFLPSREFPSALLKPPPFDMPGWMNKLEARLYFETMWLGGRPVIKMMHELLGLPPPPWRYPALQEIHLGQPYMMAYSEQILPRPADWPAHAEVTGFWFQDTPASWQPPDDLVRFIKAGPPPVYAGFGSMSLANPKQTVQDVIAALDANNARGVIAAGWSEYRPTDLPENVFTIDAMPHDWLLPQMAAAVHHGGAGTTGAALRAGIPQVVVPFLGDQFFWGLQVEKRGVGPKAVPNKQLTAKALGDAIGKTLNDRQMCQRAGEIGGHVRAENGLARAAQIIEKAVRT
jgi:UDP:flavonoid glycosyltransferase YjiC (YdhE family)